MSKGAPILGLLLFLLAFPGLGHGAVVMPAFSLPAASDGAIVTSEAYQGKTLLVTFFATWCSSCLQEIPTLKALQEKYQQQGFAVVALSVDEGGAGLVAQLAEKNGVNYPVLMADRMTAQRFGGVMALPTSFLVNGNGHVVKKYPGYTPHGVLERDIESVL